MALTELCIFLYSLLKYIALSSICWNTEQSDIKPEYMSQWFLLADFCNDYDTHSLLPTPPSYMSAGVKNSDQVNSPGAWILFFLMDALMRSAPWILSLCLFALAS